MLLWQQSFHNMSAILAAILAAILDYSKILFYTKLQQNILKLVENMCFAASTSNIIEN